MDAQDIFLPVATLALWTVLVLGLVPIARFRAAAAGRVTIDDFKTGESLQVPPDVSVPNRVFMNLLEVPVLFYNNNFVVIAIWLMLTSQLIHV